jgi:hypothetical protein
MRRSQVRLRAKPGGAGDEIRSTRSPRLAGSAIGLGRTVLGLAFALDPSLSVRFLGLDAATARRIGWLAQMTAARDVALGVGTLAATARGRGSGGWLLAGAACDLADAAALTGAIARRQVAPVTAGVVIVGAVAASATAVIAVLRGRDQLMLTPVT